MLNHIRLYCILISIFTYIQCYATIADTDSINQGNINELIVKSRQLNNDSITDKMASTTQSQRKSDFFNADCDNSALESNDTIAIISGYPKSIYHQPLSWTKSDPWWHGMWINTAVLSGAFVGTLFVLELLPEDATAWNRAEISSVPFYERWFKNIFKRGPEWDHDLFIFNYVLHPYAGAAYFMCARTCGFNFWQSMLYSAIISTVGWEFGIEACMERPSYQDILITPIIGSLMGEGMYRLKRLLVANNYEIFNSKILGHIAGFILDPVNEVIGALSSAPDRHLGPSNLSSQPLLIPRPAPGSPSAIGFTISATF